MHHLVSVHTYTDNFKKTSLGFLSIRPILSCLLTRLLFCFCNFLFHDIFLNAILSCLNTLSEGSTRIKTEKNCCICWSYGFGASLCIDMLFAWIEISFKIQGNKAMFSTIQTYACGCSLTSLQQCFVTLQTTASNMTMFSHNAYIVACMHQSAIRLKPFTSKPPRIVVPLLAPGQIWPLQTSLCRASEGVL